MPIVQTEAAPWMECTHRRVKGSSHVTGFLILKYRDNTVSFCSFLGLLSVKHITFWCSVMNRALCHTWSSLWQPEELGKQMPFISWPGEISGETRKRQRCARTQAHSSACSSLSTEGTLARALCHTDCLILQHNSEAWIMCVYSAWGVVAHVYV